jgi:hypothetical protein
MNQDSFMYVRLLSRFQIAVMVCFGLLAFHFVTVSVFAFLFRPVVVSVRNRSVCPFAKQSRGLKPQV